MQYWREGNKGDMPAMGGKRIARKPRKMSEVHISHFFVHRKNV